MQTIKSPIIGDGKSTETAFRPAIADEVDDQGKPFDWSASILTDAKGLPLTASVQVKVLSDAAIPESAIARD